MRFLWMLLMLATVAHAQVVCGPNQCCTSNCPVADVFLIGELATDVATADGQAHFILDDGTLLIPLGGIDIPFEQFNVNVVLTGQNGPVGLSFLVRFRERIKFLMSTPGAILGHGFCVGIRATGFEDPSDHIIFQNRILELNRPTFVCRDQPHGTLVCFGVRGDVTEQFPNLPAIDRVEHLCIQLP